MGVATPVNAEHRTVLITGCSTGIGRVAALRFLHEGWTVVATARRLETLVELEKLGCHTFALDVTDEASMVETLRKVRTSIGPVDVLVNNAGFGMYGPVEQLATTLIVRQFETNVFGLVRLSQLVLPMMREQHFGRIINVSSIAGRLSLPMGGAYHASKHALEAFSDALRYEVKPYGVAVSLVEPGPVRTRWAMTAASSIVIDEASGDDPYREMKYAVTGALSGMTKGLAGRFASSPDSIARVLVRAATAKHPRSRYRVGALAKFLLLLRWILPDRVFDLLVSRTFVSR